MSYKSEFAIKELSEADWREYRSIRLNSLQDSPASFGSTYEREAAFSSDQWRSRLISAPENHIALTLAAIADQVFIGLVSARIQVSVTRHANLYQMWVSPQYRGAGVGTALIERVIVWAAALRVEKLLLSVATVNEEAISLYKSVGFNSVGNSELLRADSALLAQPMEFILGTGKDCYH